MSDASILINRKESNDASLVGEMLELVILSKSETLSKIDPDTLKKAQTKISIALVQSERKILEYDEPSNVQNWDMRAIGAIFSKQEDIMKELGIHPNQIRLMSIENKTNLVLRIIYACERELKEVGDELPWKWFRNNPSLNIDNVKKEIIDAAHLVIELAILFGMDGSEFIQMYLTKSDLNIERIREEVAAKKTEKGIW